MRMLNDRTGEMGTMEYSIGKTERLIRGSVGGTYRHWDIFK